jgi:hypothetical protein
MPALQMRVKRLHRKDMMPARQNAASGRYKSKRKAEMRNSKSEKPKQPAGCRRYKCV